MGQNMQNENGGRSGWALIAVAVWALIQAGRLSALGIIQSVNAGTDAPAWLYPGYVDVFIGITAVFIAFGIWRLKGVWLWMITLIWFSISMNDHLDAIIVALNAPIPASFFGGVQSTVLTVLVVNLILDALALSTLWRSRMHYIGSAASGASVKKPTITIIVFLVWVVLQIPRYIAIPLIQNILAGIDPTEWLNPAIGDVLIATSGLFVAYLVWRKTGLWVWVVALIWLVLSVFDHASTVTAALIIGSTPKAFEAFSNGGGGAGSNAMFPLIQGGVDVLVFWLMARESIRLYFTNSSRSA